MAEEKFPNHLDHIHGGGLIKPDPKILGDQWKNTPPTEKAKNIDNAGWDVVGWLAEDINLEVKTDYDDAVMDGMIAKSYMTSQTITVNFDVDDSEWWKVHKIYQSENLATWCTEFTVILKNYLSAEEKYLTSNISNELMATLPPEEVIHLITKSAEQYLSPQQVHQVKMIMSKNDDKSWIISQKVGSIAKTFGEPVSFTVTPNAGSLSQLLPAVNENVMNPVTKKYATLRSTIMNLNDKQKWSREKIADWLETLSIDIRFKTKEESNEQA